MTKQQKEIQYAVGIEDLYLCFMDGDETVGALPKYEDIVYGQTNITELSISSKTNNFTKWASNKKIINITKNTSFELGLKLAGLDREVKDKMFSKKRTKGVSFENAKPKSYPKFAVGVVFPLNDGTKILRWYPKCTVQPVEESFKTQNEEMTVDDIEYKITADPLLFNDNTMTELDTGSASAAGIKLEDFLKQVICDESQLATLGGTTGQ
ncbi:major tail protein [Bacillus sp. NPDC077411]|uniref:major tail protein n=1 Tax=Bacillus sp. NPDC077411 TaxID=3363947 RepID=UPI0037C50033